jgi:RNA 3'-terminal phosphate cyclase (ATP)
MMYIDGSFGEGGGQILRTSLGLSLVTGKPFTIENIRAGRKNPGLLRQHLTAVQAAAEIGKAEVHGDAISSTVLVFQPKNVVPGTYHFKIGTAGSATLVLQTILPALMTGSGTSEIVLEGGTHNPFAPPYDFLSYAFLPLLEKMGVKTESELIRPGFYPAGGGKFSVRIVPAHRLKPLELVEKGPEKAIEVIGMVSDLPKSIAENEVEIILSQMHWDHGCGKAVEVSSPGPGNIVFARLAFEHVSEVFTGFGQKGVPLKTVAENVVKQASLWLAAGVPVGEHLADQLLVPFALAGGGRFRTYVISTHARTNIEIIKKFLDVEIICDRIRDNVWEITLRGN